MTDTGRRFATTMSCPEEVARREVWNEASEEQERWRARPTGERGAGTMAGWRERGGRGVGGVLGATSERVLGERE